MILKGVYAFEFCNQYNKFNYNKLYKYKFTFTFTFLHIFRLDEFLNDGR